MVQGTAEGELLSGVATGSASAPLQSFLSHLRENGVRKWEKTVDTACSSILAQVMGVMLPAAQALSYRACELRVRLHVKNSRETKNGAFLHLSVEIFRRLTRCSSSRDPARRALPKMNIFFRRFGSIFRRFGADAYASRRAWLAGRRGTPGSAWRRTPSAI